MDWTQAQIDAHEAEHVKQMAIWVAHKDAYARREARLEEIQFALGDIAETLQIWRDEKPITDPYMAKLWSEWDALITEKQRILKGQG